MSVPSMLDGIYFEHTPHKQHPEGPFFSLYSPQKRRKKKKRETERERERDRERERERERTKRIVAWFARQFRPLHGAKAITASTSDYPSESMIAVFIRCHKGDVIFFATLAVGVTGTWPFPDPHPPSPMQTLARTRWQAHWLEAVPPNTPHF